MNDFMLDAHCEISPSSFPARSICPCFDSGDGDASAASGTRSHKVVETMIYCGGDEDAARKQTGEHAFLEGTTEDEIARGVWGARQILAIYEETKGETEIITEKRVQYITSSTNDAKTVAALQGKFGTIDAYWTSIGCRDLFICDYKTYASAIGEKDYTLQGMAYALMLCSQLSQPYEHVFFNVICAGDHQIKGVVFTMEEARNAVVPLIERIEMVKYGGLFASDDAARNACGRPSLWCKNCAHAGYCTAIRNAVSTVSNDTGAVYIPLAKRMLLVPMLEVYCKRVKDAVKTALLHGERVRDNESGVEYVLKERRGQSKLTDLRGLAETLAVNNVRMDDFAAVCSVSKSAVDRLLAAANDEMTAKQREEIYSPYFRSGDIQRVLTQMRMK